MRKSRAWCSPSTTGSVTRRPRSIASASAPTNGARSRARSTGLGRLRSFIGRPRAQARDAIKASGEQPPQRLHIATVREHRPLQLAAVSAQVLLGQAFEDGAQVGHRPQIAVVAEVGFLEARPI